MFSRETLFRVDEPVIEPIAGSVTLKYSLNGEPTFAEVWDVGRFDESYLPAIRDAARLLSVCALTSYYKSVYGARIELGLTGVNPELLDVARALTSEGLSELRYVNGFPLDHRPTVLPTPEMAVGHMTPTSVRFPRPTVMSGNRKRSLVAMGGGKDSVVAATIALNANRSVKACSINPRAAMRDSCAAIAVPLIELRRTLDTELLRRNDAGAINGHIPVTAINAAALVFVATARQFDEVVFANESSASHPTFIVEGHEVNHQYSKGWDFELRLRAAISSLAIPVNYFSALRTLSSLAVCKIFSSLDPNVLSSIASCNSNFRMDADDVASQWCGDCPKCAFVFIALASFMGNRAAAELFGKDLLADAALRSVYKSLSDDGGHRPLACIGTPEEVRWAFQALWNSGEALDLEHTSDLISEIEPPASERMPLSRDGPSAVPPDFDEAIRRLL